MLKEQLKCDLCMFDIYEQNELKYEFEEKGGCHAD